MWYAFAENCIESRFSCFFLCESILMQICMFFALFNQMTTFVSMFIVFQESVALALSCGDFKLKLIFLFTFAALFWHINCQPLTTNIFVLRPYQHHPKGINHEKFVTFFFRLGNICAKLVNVHVVRKLFIHFRFTCLVEPMLYRILTKEKLVLFLLFAISIIFLVSTPIFHLWMLKNSFLHKRLPFPFWICKYFWLISSARPNHRSKFVFSDTFSPLFQMMDPFKRNRT